MQHLTFEVTTRCNLKCVMCPHGLPAGYPGQRDAEDPFIDAVIEAFDRITLLRPTGVGEPLLADSFWRIVEALKGRDRPVLNFVSNGILLTEANVSKLVAAPVKRVTVSVDAARPETHARIRGNDLSRTLSGVRNLIERFKEAAKQLEVTLSFVVMRENLVEVAEFVDMAADIGAKSVYFEHLTPLMTDASTWTVVRDGWRFNYAEQDMRADPVLADSWMSKAVDRADERGLAVGGFHIFIDPDVEAAHTHRQSRRLFFKMVGMGTSNG